MAKPNLKNCFISAPVQADTSNLRHALESRGIRWRDAVTAESSDSILRTISDAITDADFVCVVLPSGKTSPNLYFEMGLATGLSKPLLIFAADEAGIPISSPSVTYSRAGIEDTKTVNFYLDAFLKHGGVGDKAKGRRNIRRSKAKKMDVSWARHDLKASRSLPPASRGKALENIVARLFQQTGAVVSQRHSKTDGADMAVWIDELESTIGNPLIVEVKTGTLRRDRLLELERQLQSFFPKVHARAALVIYDEIGNIKITPPHVSWPLIFWFSVQQLIRFVQEGRLAEEVRSERNRLAHGRHS
ncbi:MAG TPA: hypothetical protein VNP98_01150 [Chthoniobacterales bacterium]|nr:hypothetical protein [Chthoniobacterales bacterium]